MVSLTTTHIVSIFAASALRGYTTHIAGSWEWYIVRGAGFTAAGLLILLMLSGIGQVTGWTYRFLEPVKAWAVHKALAFALCAAVITHGLFLWLDHYISFSIPKIFIPFLSHYSNHSSLLGIGLASIGVASGILAMYGVAIIVLSSLGWIDSKQKTWRWLHYLSYFVFIAVFVHALGVGSDLRYGTFREAWIALLFVILLAVVGRLWRAGTLQKSES